MSGKRARRQRAVKPPGPGWTRLPGVESVTLVEAVCDRGPDCPEHGAVEGAGWREEARQARTLREALDEHPGEWREIGSTS